VQDFPDSHGIEAIHSYRGVRLRVHQTFVALRADRPAVAIVVAIVQVIGATLGEAAAAPAPPLATRIVCCHIIIVVVIVIHSVIVEARVGIVEVMVPVVAISTVARGGVRIRTVVGVGGII